MKILKVLLYIVLGLAVLVIALGLFAKKDYLIERSTEIKAPKNLVSEYATNFNKFKEWSPWEELDPNMSVKFEGTPNQIGSSYSWTGNDQVGAGKMILKGVTPDRVDVQVDFTAPWESSSPTYYIFEEKEDRTLVTWGMKSHMPFPMNIAGIFMDIDRAIGKDYEKGLAKLKKVCEADAANKKYNGYEISEMELPTRYYSAIRSVIKMTELDKFLSANFTKVAELTEKQGAKLNGMPTGLYWNWDEKNGKTDCAAAFPIEKEQKLANGVSVFTVTGGRALVANHFGDPAKSIDAHIGIEQYINEKGLELIMPVLEEYLTDPKTEPDTAKWHIKVICFVKPKVAN